MSPADEKRSPPSGASAHLEELQRRCREDATQIQKGRFRLDWQRALDKIKDFQLADPHRYVLEVVQAAVAGGATAVDVRTDSDDVILSFDGRQYTRHELERLFDFLFTREPELEPLRQLALGVNAALGLKPKFVLVDSGDGEQGARLRLSDHSDVEVSPLPAAQVLAGTRVHVRDRISFKVLSRAIQGSGVEADLLRQACCHLPVPLLLDGHDVRRPTEPGLATRAFDVTGIRGELTLPNSADDLPRIEVLINGVQVCLLDEDMARRVGLAVHGFVDNPALTRNASHSGVHDNEELKRTLSRLRMEVRKLARAWLERLLPTDPEVRRAELQTRQFSDAERHTLQQSARLLLRGARKSDLPPELDALLDVPDMVRLAIQEPPRAPLRPIWEIFREHGQYHACAMVHDLAKDDLPAHLLPVLGPMDLLHKVFGKPSPADDVMEQIATREYNRRQRQKNPMEATLSPGVSLVKVELDDAGMGLRGEVGLCEPEVTRSVEDALAALASRHGDVDGGGRKVGRQPVVHATYLQNGVLLGQRRLKTPGFWGVAVLDCPDFSPDATWEDVSPNKAYKAVPGALKEAAPRLLARLHEAFATLPPPAPLLAAGSWDPGRGETNRLPLELSARWPSDAPSARGRKHADRLLARMARLDRQAAPWLYDWPLFYTIDGEALSMDLLLERREQVRYAVNAPWGEAPDDMLLVNISTQQKSALRRYLPGKLVSGKRRLNRWRKERAKEAQQRETYERNRSRAELFRQKPRLDELDYLAVMDLDLPDGAGQVGIPATPSPSRVRYLIDGVPLPDEPLSKTDLPLHAVVQSATVQPNEDFTAVDRSRATRDIGNRVRRAESKLVSVLALSPAGRTRAGVDMVWRFLNKVRTSASRPMVDLPSGVADLPLLLTVAHRWISLRAAHEDALQHEHRLLFTTTEATSQLCERPIIRGDKRLMKLLRRLLHVHSQNYDLPLNAEQGVLAKLARPRQEARLQGDMWVRVEVTGEQISGEVGLPRDTLWKVRPGPVVAEVKVLREGVMLRRRPVDLLGLPALGVVECPRLTPDDLYSDVRQDQVWRDVLQALQAAAREMVKQICGHLASDQPARPAREAMGAALQMVAGHLFRGRPGLELEDGDELGQAVARAPVWPSAGEGHDPYTLARLAEACRGPAVLWVVGARSGKVQPGRVIVRAPDEYTEQALEQIFGDEVQDGSRVLRRENAAYIRRMAAPSLGATMAVSEALAPTDVHHEEQGLTLRGQVAVCRNYEHARPGRLTLRVGVDGRKICEREVPHALRGVGQVEGQGLKANRDWNGLADQRQIKLLEEAAAEALWGSAREVIRRALRTGRRQLGRGAERLLMLEVLAATVGEADDAVLLEAPLFTTVHGQQISAAALRRRADEQGDVLVVSDTLGEGVPPNGETIIRADPAALVALERLLEGAVQRHDEVWQDVLAGQARRRETPVSAPNVSTSALEQVYFSKGPSTGLAGLLPLPSGKDGPRSMVRLHVANRRVATRQPRWSPAVDVWINDDRLQPTLDFCDVEQDVAYWQVMEVAEAQIPELLACAAQGLVHGRHGVHGEKLGPWLRARVMGRLEELQTEAAAAPLGPASRTLRAAIWRCLTAAGQRWVDTAELLAAHGTGHLALVPADAAGTPEDQVMVLVPATKDERAALQACLGELPDHGDRLRSDEAHRVFLWRRQVPRVNLDAAGVHDDDQQVLWRRRLDNAGWQGELGLLRDGGQQITVTFFWERRRLAVATLPCVVPAVCAVQSSLLSVNTDYTDVQHDEAHEAWVKSLKVEVATTLRRAAADLPDQPEKVRRRLRPLLLGALARLDSRQDRDARELAEALMGAPLLLDAAGRPLSVAAAVESQEGPVAVIDPRTADRGRALDPRLVLVLPEQDRQALGRLLNLEPYDEVYLRGVQARRRMDCAPASADVSWYGTVARGDVASEHLRGELALKLSRQPGKIWLMSRGRVVEERVFEQFAGLVGYVDGKLATDSAFKKVNLNRRQQEELARLYVVRLEQVVQQAHEYRGRRWQKWRRLAALVMRFLLHRLRESGVDQGQLRDMVLARDTTLSPAVVRALDLRLFRLGDGSWVDLATVIAGDDPRVALCENELRRPPAGVTVVVGEAELLRPLLSLLLPAGAVADLARWVEQRQQKARKRKAASREPARVINDRLLSGLRATLRSALQGALGPGPTQLRLSVIKKIKVQALPRAELTRVERRGDKVKRVVVNPEHALWKATARAAAGARATPIKHLAAALLAAWCRRPCEVISRMEVVRLLTALAEGGG